MPAQPRSVQASPAAIVEAVLGASRVFTALATRSLSDVAEEVTLAQYRALVVLRSRGPQHVASLADALAVTPPTATRMCDRLVRKGLVRRRSSRQDRRQVDVALTTAGRELVDNVMRRRREEISQLLARIPVEDQEAMVELFGQLARAAGEVPDRDWGDWAL